jgi:hypothetical protein
MLVAVLRISRYVGNILPYLQTLPTVGEYCFLFLDLDFCLSYLALNKVKYMPNLNPSDVAAWFREQAKRCREQAEERAKEFEQMAVAAEKVNMVLHWGTSPGPSPASPRYGTLTADQFEQRIRQKSARVYKIAEEFNVTEKTVEALLEPNSKVFMGERGWLYVRANNGS